MSFISKNYEMEDKSLKDIYSDSVQNRFAAYLVAAVTSTVIL